MSISISDFTVTADNGNKPSDFNGLFIQGVSLININAVVSTDADSLDVSIAINGALFYSRHATDQTFTINQTYRLKEAYIGGPMELKIEILAVDSNNNTGESSRTITVYPYQKPMLKPKSGEAAISVFRCSNSGVRDDSATSARLMAELKAQDSVGSISLNPKIYIRSKTVNETWENASFNEVQYINLSLQIISGSFSNSIGYNIQLKVEDELSSSEIYEFSLPSVLITFEAAPGGKKVAVGGTTNGLPDDSFTSYWNATMKENLYVKKDLDVTGKSTFHDDVTIPTANITNANITNYNTLGDYVKQKGTLYTSINPLINTQAVEEDASDFYNAMLNVWMHHFEDFSIISTKSIPWNYILWNSGRIELTTSIPFVYFKVASITVGGRTLNLSNIDNEINNASTTEERLYLEAIKVYFLRNNTEKCGRLNELEQYNLPEITYPSEINFSNIPLEFGDFYASINPSWLSIKSYNSGNTRTTAKEYALITANGGFVTHESNINLEGNQFVEKIYYFQGFLKLLVIGNGSITIQQNQNNG